MDPDAVSNRIHELDNNLAARAFSLPAGVLWLNIVLIGVENLISTRTRTI